MLVVLNEKVEKRKKKSWIYGNVMGFSLCSNTQYISPRSNQVAA